MEVVESCKDHLVQEKKVKEKKVRQKSFKEKKVKEKKIKEKIVKENSYVSKKSERLKDLIEFNNYKDDLNKRYTCSLPNLEKMTFEEWSVKYNLPSQSVNLSISIKNSTKEVDEASNLVYEKDVETNDTNSIPKLNITSGDKFELSPYNSHISWDDESFDQYINVSGPTWTLAFISIDPSSCSEQNMNKSLLKDVFLVVGTSRIGLNLNTDSGDKYVTSNSTFSYDNDHILGSLENYPNLLQIWKFNESKGFELAYFVGLPDSGSIWEAAWNPSSQMIVSHDQIYEDEMKDNDNNDHDNDHDHENDNESSKVLGVLAILCGNGTVEILILPTNPNAAGDRLRKYVYNIENLRKYIIKMPVIESKGTQMLQPQITSICWRNEFELVCGTGSGHIAIFKVPDVFQDNLTNRNVFKLPDDILIDLTQYEPDYPGMNAIRKVTICPQDDKILVSGGHDLFIKVWDLESDLYRPFYQTVPAFQDSIGLIHDIQWDVEGNGILVSGLQNSSIWQEPLWGKLPWKVSQILHKHEFTKDGDEIFYLSVASDGSVMLTRKFIKGSQKNRNQFEIFKINNISVNKSSSANKSCDQILSIELSTNSVIKTISKNFSESKGKKYNLPPPGVSLKALDSIIVPSLISNEEIPSKTKEKLFVAYGGVVGLLRIHSFP